MRAACRLTFTAAIVSPRKLRSGPQWSAVPIRIPGRRLRTPSRPRGRSQAPGAHCRRRKTPCARRRRCAPRTRPLPRLQAGEQHAAVCSTPDRNARTRLQRTRDDAPGAGRGQAGRRLVFQIPHDAASPSEYARRYSNGWTMRGRRAECRYDWPRRSTFGVSENSLSC